MPTAGYTTRIELHAPSEEAYRKLDRAMAAAGFSRAGPPPAGSAGHTVHAEYYRETDQDLDGTFEAARDAASQLQIAFTVLVCESRTQKWIGLRVSTPA